MITFKLSHLDVQIMSPSIDIFLFRIWAILGFAHNQLFLPQWFSVQKYKRACVTYVANVKHYLAKEKKIPSHYLKKDTREITLMK